MCAMGACDTAIIVTSWFSRWTTKPSQPSAIAEQAGQPAVYSGPNMKWYIRSCERPRKRSASEAPPSSVSNRYSLSIRTHGSSCRRRARSSLRRVSSFSASRSSSRAASHSLRVPVLCFVIVLGPLLLAGARPRLRVRPFHDRPHLDAPQARGRDLRGYLDGVVQIPGLDQIEPAQLLLRLGEGPVRGERLAVLDPDGGSRLSGLEGIRGNVVPALPENLVI